MTDWADRRTPAVERILDAAGELFAEHGVTGVTGVAMADVAVAAGCSRATLYRYFPDRAALDRAFVQREALRVGGLVAADLAAVPRADAVTEGVLASLHHVRAAPALMAWFADPTAGRTADLAAESEVVAALGLSVTDDPAAARWLVRVIVSLLTAPEADAAEERALVERFVAPGVRLSPSSRTDRSSFRPEHDRSARDDAQERAAVVTR
ncbi:TetR/AcrR family transcriptional regulator [Nocardioides caeni]|uniref:Helix-turn-helix transcriptional regulator n=1 Tax=Nocardioides caeni TaxID=574700 RepID=A0A4S8N2G8_9ACTN|nr:TetR family transcriptional regulator [Nocardioides caeni]THV08974.1 helix-turn-helix transcriptional regulator [Nocardioides caeni]